MVDIVELQGTRAKGRICATCLQEGSIKQKNMYIYIINVCSERHDVQIGSTHIEMMNSMLWVAQVPKCVKSGPTATYHDVSEKAWE